MTELTTEIMESDELFHKWLWGELYDALKSYCPAIEAELAEIHHETMYGTGEGEPIGILNLKDLARK